MPATHIRKNVTGFIRSITELLIFLWYSKKFMNINIELKTVPAYPLWPAIITAASKKFLTV